MEKLSTILRFIEKEIMENNYFFTHKSDKKHTALYIHNGSSKKPEKGFLRLSFLLTI
jgi:hypothetical protein